MTATASGIPMPGDLSWLAKSVWNELAVVDDGAIVRRARIVGCAGDRNAMAALERMLGPVVFVMTRENSL